PRTIVLLSVASIVALEPGFGQNLINRASVAGKSASRPVISNSTIRFFSPIPPNDNGKDDAYVRPFDPATMSSKGDAFLVSRDGGTSPVWRGDGEELFYCHLTER